MFEDHNATVQEVLADAGLVSREQLGELHQAHLATGKALAEVVVDAGLVDRPALLRAVAQYLQCEYLERLPGRVDDDLGKLVPAHVARMYGVVPLRGDAVALTLAAVDPLNSHIVDDLTFSLNRDIHVVVADPGEVDELLRATYGEEETSLDEILREIDPGRFSGAEEADARDLEAAASETPIIRFVNLVLAQAIRDKASDIHFEPYEDQFRIRYRIDGALYEMAPPPLSLALPVISRIKVLADLNIAERRVPQDGRIKMTLAGRPVDLRVSTLPTQFGESVVLRVLDKSVVNLDLDQLHLPDDIKGQIRAIAARPNGIFIVTGPTGSGKTTTLYSALREVNRIETKILTAEDPIEYEIEGIMQVAVNPAVGLTFARALRSFLRQDPDKILVGEIRDLETAQIAVQASLTGHLVLSTLHTNDAAGAVTRLTDMGLEPYLIAASLESILAQRLVRRICTHCRRPYEPAPELVASLELDAATLTGRSFHFGAGCRECNRTGYRGRLGLFEMIMVNDILRDLITRRASTLEIRRKAMEQGMRTLREDGIRAIFDGQTTLEEVLKYT